MDKPELEEITRNGGDSILAHRVEPLWPPHRELTYESKETHEHMMEGSHRCSSRFPMVQECLHFPSLASQDLGHPGSGEYCTQQSGKVPFEATNDSRAHLYGQIMRTCIRVDKGRHAIPSRTDFLLPTGFLSKVSTAYEHSSLYVLQNSSYE